MGVLHGRAVLGLCHYCPPLGQLLVPRISAAALPASLHCKPARAAAAARVPKRLGKLSTLFRAKFYVSYNKVLQPWRTGPAGRAFPLE